MVNATKTEELEFRNRKVASVLEKEKRNLEKTKKTFLSGIDQSRFFIEKWLESIPRCPSNNTSYQKRFESHRFPNDSLALFGRKHQLSPFNHQTDSKRYDDPNVHLPSLGSPCFTVPTNNSMKKLPQSIQRELIKLPAIQKQLQYKVTKFLERIRLTQNPWDYPIADINMNQEKIRIAHMLTPTVWHRFLKAKHAAKETDFSPPSTPVS